MSIFSTVNLQEWDTCVFPIIFGNDNLVMFDQDFSQKVFYIDSNNKLIFQDINSLILPIQPSDIYSSAQNKVLISNNSNSYTESNISDLFANYPYFIYGNGASKQYILDSDLQTNEISVSKIKSQNLYYLVGVQTVGSGMSEILMNKTNVDNIFQSASIQSSKNIFVNNYKLLGNVTGTNQAGQEITLTRTNNNLLFDNNSIEIDKIYSSDTPSSYSIFAVDNNLKLWGDDSTLTKLFWDNIFASNVIDTTKIENASGTYYFFGRFNGSTPTYFRITSSTGADLLFSDYTIPPQKLIYGGNSLFHDSASSYNDSLTFNKVSALNYQLVFSMVSVLYDQSCYISCIATSGTFANNYMQFDAKSASPITWAFSFRQNGGQIGYINRSTGSYVAVSDQNLKENIIYCDAKKKQQILDDFQKLSFCHYQMKSDEEKNQNFGIIAQDLLQLESFKNCVQKGENNLFVDQTHFQNICIQALKCENEMQKQKIKDLEQENQDIKKRIGDIEEKLEKLLSALK